MVGIRKVLVYGTPVGILQHRGDAAAKLLGLTLGQTGKHVSMRLSALPPIIGGDSDSIFQAAFVPALPGLLL